MSCSVDSRARTTLEDLVKAVSNRGMWNVLFGTEVRRLLSNFLEKDAVSVVANVMCHSLDQATFTSLLIMGSE